MYTGKAVSACRELIDNFNVEVFGVLLLDQDGRYQEGKLLNVGEKFACSVNMREVAKYALSIDSGFVIFFHTHPNSSSDHIVVSGKDKLTTQKSVEVLSPLGIRIVDHIILSKDKHYSMAENSMLLSTIPTTY